MEHVKEKVKAFLKTKKMDYEQLSMDRISRTFLDDMDKGLAGKKSSLAMLATYIETERQIPKNKPVVVMDAGGTNFRVATVYFGDDGKAVISDFNKFQMPGIGKEVSKEEFFNTMAGYIKAIINKSDNVGFCFSYPIEMFPNKDGRVLYFSKEIRAPQVAGEMIGENLRIAITAAGYKVKKRIVLLNDTVATLLAGRADTSGRAFDSYIGFILGTGTNCSYIEQNKNITKIKDVDRSASQIVNVESGGFGGAPRGVVDEQFDKDSLCPGVNVFEKMISGAYLGPLCLRTAQVAADEGLFCRIIADKIKKISETTTKDVDDFMRNPIGRNLLANVFECKVSEDLVALYYLVDSLIERAAKLTATNLSSVAIKSGKGRNPCCPLCIVAEGTTFYQLKSLKLRTEFYLKQYLEDKKGIYHEIINVENATLIGAAIAGLTN